MACDDCMYVSSVERLFPKFHSITAHLSVLRASAKPCAKLVLSGVRAWRKRGARCGGARCGLTL